MRLYKHLWRNLFIPNIHFNFINFYLTLLKLFTGLLISAIAWPLCYSIKFVLLIKTNLVFLQVPSHTSWPIPMPSIPFRKPGVRLYPAENSSVQNKKFFAGLGNQLGSNSYQNSREQEKTAAPRERRQFPILVAVQAVPGFEVTWVVSE